MGLASVSMPTLYGYSDSGNCLKAKWIADLTGYAYDWVSIDIMSGESRTEDFLALSTAGQVPVLRLPDDTVIEQSNAILFYIAEQASSSLIPTNAVMKAQMLAWMFWEQYSHETAIAVRRFRKAYQNLPEDQIEAHLFPKGYAALDRMENQLQGQPWIVGDDMTLADIALVAYTRVAHEGGFDLAKYPNIRGWISHVEEQLNIPHITEPA